MTLWKGRAHRERRQSREVALARSGRSGVDGDLDVAAQEVDLLQRSELALFGEDSTIGAERRQVSVADKHSQCSWTCVRLV
jgi:hypothetical protein